MLGALAPWAWRIQAPGSLWSCLGRSKWPHRSQLSLSRASLSISRRLVGPGRCSGSINFNQPLLLSGLGVSERSRFIHVSKIPLSGQYVMRSSQMLVTTKRNMKLAAETRQGELRTWRRQVWLAVCARARRHAQSVVPSLACALGHRLGRHLLFQLEKCVACLLMLV